MTNSEQRLSWILGSCITIFVMYALILNPLWVSAAQHQEDAQTLASKRDLNQAFIDSSPQFTKKWNNFLKNKNLTTSEEDAKAIFNENMTQWQNDSGITRTTYKTKKPSKIKKTKDFMRIEYQTSATGTLEQITDYLGLIESANIPIKIEKLNITSRKESDDSLTLSLTLSTIYSTPQKKGATR